MDTSWLTLLFALCLFGSANIVNSHQSNCESGTECLHLKDCKVYYEHLKKLKSTNLAQHRDFLMNNITSLTCGYEGTYPKVCCPVKKEVEKEESTENCGLFISDRMLTIDGASTDLFEYPWLALLQYKSLTGKRNGCGGVLINSRYVLTSAFCVYQYDELISVRLGEYNLNTDPDCFFENPDKPSEKYCGDKVIEVGVESTIAHPRYTGLRGAGAIFDKSYDIALVRLNQSVKFSDSVKPICLPDRDSKDIGNGKYAVAGWGVTPFAEFPKTNVKRQFKMDWTNWNECRDIYGWTLERDVICASARNIGVGCYGDFGGSLMAVDRMGRFSVVGIYTQADSNDLCWTGFLPNTYTDVTQYRDWIAKNIKH